MECPEELLGQLDNEEVFRALLVCIADKLGVTEEDIYRQAANEIKRREPTEGLN